ncbi:hypothetical protein HWC35_gp044 [Vibrio phage USC-1]|uniref:Uncharacterized protein n=2 Tax=Aphroditevirus USC1 TaxID=2846605 RepID=A0A514A2C9_9CAUD|nr:hypothetical protein HWC35_gp044 [Vibrio phage USC-1]QCW23290.1 hypothetical protein [Vibrio phage 5 TSL-2019]QDH47438.1 hypothetical protein [Vibrio phage USC-1]
MGLLVVVVMAIMLLTGCSTKPSFQEGSAQLKVNAEVAKMDIVRANVGALRSSVLDIPPYLKENPPKLSPSELLALQTFLSSNKCEGDLVPRECHYASIVYTIELANRSDQRSEELYGAKVTIQSLLKTLNRIYAILDSKPPDSEEE